jgi:AbrB family looped-hinge helix DNA binding protein
MPYLGMEATLAVQIRPRHLSWYFHGMKVAIDNAGRMVIPKSFREELGISGAAEVEMRAVDGRIEMTVPDVPARVELRDGVPVIVTDRPMQPITIDETRAAIDRSRR